MQGIMQLWPRSKRATQENHPMHDLLIALAFIGVFIAPAIAAARSGSDSTAESQ
jgi:hypothetical protein